MRRVDRLFQIVQLIRGRRLTTAAFLARRLEISQRTVYRDIADLQHQGVPIDGEAGVGYRLGRGFELPPLMFTQDEAHALVAAARLAQGWVDPAMALSMQDALGKILSVLPPAVRVSAEAVALHASAGVLDDATRRLLKTLRQAIDSRQTLALTYRDALDETTRRRVHPLGCFHWGAVWTLATWCELRQDFRAFRIDRIEEAEPLEEHFDDDPGRTLVDLLRRVRTQVAPDGPSMPEPP